MPRAGAISSAMPWRSSVTTTAWTRTWSSSWSKRSPAASRITASLAWVASSVALGPASVVDHADGEVHVEPDDVGFPGGQRQDPGAAAADGDGGCGRCTGLGVPSRPVTR